MSHVEYLEMNKYAKKKAGLLRVELKSQRKNSIE